ncbi:hypothetical protein CkP1_0022 [Citrobacter phage CkP1]|nr:hypothetical protein CkP1_0022 [Citrobacter phage CkP1]
MTEESTITTFGLEFVSNIHRNMNDKDHPLYKREIMVAILNQPLDTYGVEFNCNVSIDELKEGYPEGVTVFVKRYATYRNVKNSPFSIEESFLINNWKIPEENTKDIIPNPRFGTKSSNRVFIPDMSHRDEYGQIHNNSWLITDDVDMRLFKRGIWHLIGCNKTETIKL